MGIHIRTLLCAFLFLTLGLVFAVEKACADVQAGVEKYKAGDYQGAMAEWLPSAREDDPYALFFMGQLYRLGRGVETNLKLAEYYYDRAARLGHVAAQGNIGTLYYFADEKDRRADAAVRWWQIAAANGDPRSQYMLGVLNFNGADVEKNWPRAYGWMLLARVGGIDEAQAALDQMDRYLSAEQTMEGARLSSELLSAIPVEAIADMAPDAPDVAPPDELTPSADEVMVAESPVEEEIPAAAEEMISSASATQDLWRVQIAAYDRVESAQAAWARLQKRHPDLLGELQDFIVEVDLGEKGRFFRLQVGPFDARDAAANLCTALQDEGQNCLVVSAPF